MDDQRVQSEVCPAWMAELLLSLFDTVRVERVLEYGVSLCDALRQRGAGDGLCGGFIDVATMTQAKRDSVNSFLGRWREPALVMTPAEAQAERLFDDLLAEMLRGSH